MAALTDDELQAIWTIASDMADRNDVEDAWFLRGVADALAGEEPMPKAENPEYDREYRQGFDAVAGRE